MPEAPNDARADPDADLLPAIAAGDARACAILVDRHAGRVHGLASRLLGDGAEADDVSQEVFIAAWKHAGRWRPDGGARFSTWLTRVTLNACRDRLRTRRIRSASSVRAALEELPPRQREALVLCHYQGLRQDEAAAAMELSVDALESLLARARRTLRTRLEGESA
jgi:RNA polymerase sigma-70 factor, ECF subfamily